MNSKLSPAERYAETIRETAVDEILKTLKVAKRWAQFIVIAVMVVSYQHQRHFFVSRQADTIGSLLLPIIFDASIIFLVRVISTTGIAKLPQRAALAALVIPVTASAWVNFAASPNSFIGWVYVVAVGLVAVIETIKALIKPDPEALREAENSAAPAAAVVDDDATERRRAAALKGAETRRQNRADAVAKAEEKRAARRARAAAKRLEELAPKSPGQPVVILSPSDKEALANLMARS